MKRVICLVTFLRFRLQSVLSAHRYLAIHKRGSHRPNKFVQSVTRSDVERFARPTHGHQHSKSLQPLLE